MKVCVVGAGAIGGMVGVRLALSGAEVTLIARGAHLDAIKRDGLKLIMNDGSEHIARDVKATNDMRQAGHQDLIILALKAHQIAPVVDDVCSMFGPESVVLTMQNGIPWWYFQRHGGPFEGHVIKSLDPHGYLSKHVEPERIIGCIAYPAAEIVRPGVIQHVEGDRFPIGELDGSESFRAKAISEILINAGFKSPILPDIRSEIWLKAWGNLTFNPISALTHSTLVDICQFSLTRRLAEQMMLEAQRIAGKLGITFRVPLEKRIKGAERVGKHKTSMLQDVEAGKEVEVDALVGSIVELGELTETPTPHILSVYALTKLLARTMKAENVCVRGEVLA